jgi:hypothetical protein
MTNFSVVSSDDVIASYRQQLSDAHHTVAMLESRLAKALKYIEEMSPQTQALSGQEGGA